jgi:hypothetical protein
MFGPDFGSERNRDPPYSKFDRTEFLYSLKCREVYIQLSYKKFDELHGFLFNFLIPSVPFYPSEVPTKNV